VAFQPPRRSALGCAGSRRSASGIFRGPRHATQEGRRRAPAGGPVFGVPGDRERLPRASGGPWRAVRTGGPRDRERSENMARRASASVLASCCDDAQRAPGHHGLGASLLWGNGCPCLDGAAGDCSLPERSPPSRPMPACPAAEAPHASGIGLSASNRESISPARFSGLAARSAGNIVQSVGSSRNVTI